MQITEEVRCAVGARQQTGGTNPVVSDQGVKEHYPGAQGAHLRLSIVVSVGNFCRTVARSTQSLRPPKLSQQKASTVKPDLRRAKLKRRQYMRQWRL